MESRLNISIIKLQMSLQTLIFSIFNSYMKALILIFLSFLSFSMNAQTFQLSDSSFLVGDIYRAKKIRFHLSHWAISEESFLELDSLVRFLLHHPELKIEVGVHFDTRVSDTQSQRLDRKRAQSIVDYLITKGVEQYRLTAVGYWKNVPLITQKEINRLTTVQEKEEAHSINRRIEFKIIELFPLKEFEMHYDSLGNLSAIGKYIEVDSAECHYCFDEYYQQYFYTDRINLRVGTWQFFHPNGQLKEFGEFSIKVHEYRGSHKDEKQDSEYITTGYGYISRDYLKDGECKYFDEQGNYIRTEKYVCGHLIYVTDF